MLADLICNEYCNRMTVFCDGSQDKEAVGCGIWGKGFSILARIPSNALIYTAELEAILLSINFIASEPGKYVIFTDSLGSIRGLQNSNPSKIALIVKIKELLRQQPIRKIIIDWVLSHMGIPGNEEGEKNAKKSLKLDTIINIPLPINDIYRSIDKFYEQLWKWQLAANQVTVSIDSGREKNEMAISRITSRRHQTVYTRLKLGICLLMHKHHIHKCPRAECRACGCAMSLEHLIIIALNSKGSV